MATTLGHFHPLLRSLSAAWMYRPTLFGAAACVAVAGHLGGLLVRSADFLRP